MSDEEDRVSDLGDKSVRAHCRKCGKLMKMLNNIDLPV